MSHPSEERLIFESARHCTKYGCRKCIARAKWNRRKAWRASKHPNRPRNGRK